MKTMFLEVHRTVILNNISVRCTSENGKNLNTTNILRLCRFYEENLVIHNSQMIDYEEYLYEVFPKKIMELTADTPPQWGKMNAHQLMEHLTHTFSWSNGRFQLQPEIEAERYAKRKARFLENDVPFDKNVRVQGIPETPVQPMFASFEESRDFMFDNLERFSDYFNEHPDLEPLHPVFGAMNYDEWVQLHARHVRHHLEQFGL